MSQKGENVSKAQLEKFACLIEKGGKISEIAMLRPSNIRSHT